MSVHAADSHAHDGGHAHHWETSAAPLVISVGLLLLVPLGFSSYFIYENTVLALIFAGLGIAALLYGVGIWVSEALTTRNLVEGAAAIGFPLFIVSEMFMFMALFVGYWATRLFAPSWPPAGTPAMETTTPLIMLALMVVSSVALFTAGKKHAAGDLVSFRSGLLLTIVLGVAFLGLTAFEYTHLIGAGFIPGSSVFSSAYYAITGFHAVHVLLGVGMFLYMYIFALSGKTNKTFVLCGSIFWYFLTIASVFVVSQVYFW
ncbi:MAG: heme-copper oxidase subunit III [Rhodospirillaceae bacterium]